MKCRICNNIEGNKTYEVREMMWGLRETFAYFQCSKCECFQISQIPSDMSKLDWSVALFMNITILV